MAQEIHIRLDLSVDEFRRYYAGAARAIQVRSLDGRIVRFPADVMREHVEHDGIHGEFRLLFDDHFKLIECLRVS